MRSTETDAFVVGPPKADILFIIDVDDDGDIIEPDDGILAIGSGGAYALAAARALRENTALTPAEIVRKSLGIAGQICIYTNDNITVLEPTA